MRSLSRHTRFRLQRVPLGNPVEEWKRDAFRGARKALGRTATIRVRVTPGFVLLCASVGAGHGISGSVAALGAIGSVLAAHEVPRALLARAWGRFATVSLSAFGGVLEHDGEPFRGWAASCAATVGSIGNGITALGLFALGRHLGAASESLLGALAHAHCVWGVLQLLPLAPFDAGGALTRGVPPAGRLSFAIASAILVVVGAAMAFSSPIAPLTLGIVVLAVMGAARSFVQAFRDASDVRTGVIALATNAEVQLSGGDCEGAVALARKGLTVALSKAGRGRLHRVLAWAAIGRGDPLTAHVALAGLPPDEREVHLVAAYLSTCNRVDEAVALLEEVRRIGHRSRETTKLLVDLLFRREDRTAVRVLAEADHDLLSAEDRRTIEGALATA